MSLLKHMPKTTELTKQLAAWTALVLLWLTAVGCSEPEGPLTHPVKGRVEFVRGGKVYDLFDQQGSLQFQKVDDPDVYAFGAINEDGTFSLNAVKGSESWQGALPGKYRGRFNLDDETQVARKFLDYKTSGIEITVPTNEEVVIKVFK